MRPETDSASASRARLADAKGDGLELGRRRLAVRPHVAGRERVDRATVRELGEVDVLVALHHAAEDRLLGGHVLAGLDRRDDVPVLRLEAVAGVDLDVPAADDDAVPERTA